MVVPSSETSFFSIRKGLSVNVCDKCRGKLIVREDDKPEAIKKRLATYHEQTEPLKEYYKSQSKLITIDGSGTIEEVKKEIFKQLDLK